MASYRNPEDEYDVEVYADIEVTCRECDEEYTIYDALLSGNQWSLANVWTCSKCDKENIEEYDTDRFIG